MTLWPGAGPVILATAAGLGHKPVDNELWVEDEVVPGEVMTLVGPPELVPVVAIPVEASEFVPGVTFCGAFARVFVLLIWVAWPEAGMHKYSLAPGWRPAYICAKALALATYPAGQIPDAGDPLVGV